MRTAAPQLTKAGKAFPAATDGHFDLNPAHCLARMIFVDRRLGHEAYTFLIRRKPP